jgi:hypothetical protein
MTDELWETHKAKTDEQFSDYKFKEFLSLDTHTQNNVDNIWELIKSSIQCSTHKIISTCKSSNKTDNSNQKYRLITASFYIYLQRLHIIS